MNDKVLKIEDKLEKLTTELHNAETGVWKTFKEVRKIHSTPESLPMVENLMQDEIVRYAEMIEHAEATIKELEKIRNILYEAGKTKKKHDKVYKRVYKKAQDQIKPHIKKIRNILQDEPIIENAKDPRKAINIIFKSIQAMIRKEFDEQ